MDTVSLNCDHRRSSDLVMVKLVWSSWFGQALLVHAGLARFGIASAPRVVFYGLGLHVLRIPAKPNAGSGGKPNGIPG
jgi:hypothetical protein